MKKRSQYINTISEIRDFRDLSIPLKNNFNENTYFFNLKNIDDSNYKLSVLDNSFVINQSDITYSALLNDSLSDLKLKVQKEKVTKVSSSFPFEGNICNIISDLSYIEELVLIGSKIEDNLSSLPVSLSKLYLLSSVDVAVNLSDINKRLKSIELSGDIEVNQYTSTTWVNGLTRLVLLNNKGDGLSSSEVDNLLEDLSISTLGSNAVIRILGNNAERTSASDGFVSSLESQGATVETNSEITFTQA